MAVSQLAFKLSVLGIAGGDFVVTQPAIMAMTNGVHVAITCLSFMGSGKIEMWIQTSDDLEMWSYLGGGGSGSSPGGSLLNFTGVGAQQATVASTSSLSGYDVPVGALWLRFLFRVTVSPSGTVTGTFSVRTNSFVA